MTANGNGKKCPCGNPVIGAPQKKYCSPECRRYYSGLKTRNKPGYKERQKELHKKWRDRNRDHVRACAKKNNTPEKSRQTYLKNREKHLSAARAYYLANAEKIKERTRKWASQNRERVARKAAEYRASHRKELADKAKARYSKIREYMLTWREKNKDRLREKKQQWYWSMTPEERAEIQKRHRQSRQRKRMELRMAQLSEKLKSKL